MIHSDTDTAHQLNQVVAVNQNEEAMREAKRGVGECLLTGKAPQLSIRADRPMDDDHYAPAIDAVTGALFDREMLDGDEVKRMIDSALSS